MGKLWNRVINTLGIAPRTVKTASRTTIDTTKSALNLVLDPFVGLGKTGADIKKAIHESFTKGPWYHRLWKVPTSLALTPFMAIEGVAETLRGTGVNACSSVRDIIGNTLKNEGSAIKMIGRSEKFDFSTEKLEYKKVSPRNRLASLFKPKTAEDLENKRLKDKEKYLKAQEEKLRKDRENRRDERKKERENRNNEYEKYRQDLKQQQELSNKKIEELKKENSLLKQQNKDLEVSSKKSNTETSENKEAKVVKLEPKQEGKSEVKTEGKAEAKVVKLEPKQEGKSEAKTEGKTEAKADSKETGGNSENTETKQAA